MSTCSDSTGVAEGENVRGIRLQNSTGEANDGGVGGSVFPENPYCLFFRLPTPLRLLTHFSPVSHFYNP